MECQPFAASRRVDGDSVKRIFYASGGFVTADSVADALMEYAGVLAVVNSSDVVECVGIDEDGVVGSVRMLIGPASQIMAVHTNDEAVDLNAEATVAELQRRAAERLPDYTNIGAHPQSSGAGSDPDGAQDPS